MFLFCSKRCPEPRGCSEPKTTTSHSPVPVIKSEEGLGKTVIRIFSRLGWLRLTMYRPVDHPTEDITACGNPLPWCLLSPGSWWAACPPGAFVQMEMGLEGGGVGVRGGKRKKREKIILKLKYSILVLKVFKDGTTIKLKLYLNSENPALHTQYIHKSVI